MGSSQFTDLSGYTVDTGSSSAGALAEALIAKEVQRQARKNLVMANLVRTKFVDGNADTLKGKSITIPSIADATANDKSLGQSVTLQDPTVSGTTISLNQHKEVSFLIEDIAELQANQDFRQHYVGRALYAINAALDTYLMNFYTSFNSSECTGSGGALCETDILTARKNLLDDKVPYNEELYAVVGTTTEKDLLAIERFTSAEVIGTPGRITEGSVGKVHGFDVFVSQNVPSVDTSGDSPDDGTEEMNLFFHREALGLVLQQTPRVQLSYQQAYLGWLLTVDCVFGAAMLNGSWGEVIER